MPVVATAHLASVLFLTGMIWTIQVVHYPLFARVGDEAFASYMTAHQSRISSLILLPWAVQGITTVLLLASPPAGVPYWLVLAAAAAAAVTVLATVLLAIPIHQQLSAGPDAAMVGSLTAGNWVRTAAWSANAVLATIIVARAT